MAKWYIDKNGYRRFSDSDKPVHRWVMENKFGNKLADGTVVHHKNRDKTDNRPSNLWAFGNQEKHDRTHRKDKKRFGFW